MGIQGLFNDVQTLVDSEDVDLDGDAAGWIVALRYVYEFLLLVAAVTSAYLIVKEGTWSSVLNWLIWVWFAADYSIRLYASEDRKDYIATHRLELLAALPLEFFRVLRVLRVLRPLGILMRATRGMRDVLGLHGFTLIGSVGVAVVLLGGALFSWVEPETAPTISDGMWWSIVTTTTVGYGDIYPVTTGGRVIAGILMVAGIGLLGAITGEVAEQVMKSQNSRGETNDSYSSGDADIDHIVDRLRGWSKLSEGERVHIAGMLNVLAKTDMWPITKAEDKS